MNRISVDGRDVAYADVGAGRSVVLVHGGALGSSSYVWSRLTPLLVKRGYRVIAPDLPGYGESEAPADASVGRLRQLLRQFIEAVADTPVHLVGHSVSGGHCVALALDAPQLTRSVVVVGTGSLLAPLPEQEAGSPPPGDGGPEPSEPPTREQTMTELSKLVTDPATYTDEFVDTWQRYSTGASFTAALARNAARQSGAGGKAKAAMWRKLPDVTVPLMLIYGELDRGQAAQRVALTRQLLPDIRIALLQQCRHLVQWEAADQLATIVADFFDASSPAASFGVEMGYQK